MSDHAQRIQVSFAASGNVRMRLPEQVDRPSLPCLVAIHGYAQPLDAFFEYACTLAPEAVVLMPEGPMSFYRRRRGADGHRLIGHAWIAELPREASDRRNDAYIHAALDAASAEAPIDPDRTVFLGFSQGVGVALHALLSQPTRARGLVGLAGGLAQAYREHLPRLAGKDVLWVTGQEDPAYTPDYAATLRDALEASGADVESHDLPVGHELMEPAAERVRAWLAPRLGA